MTAPRVWVLEKDEAAVAVSAGGYARDAQILSAGRDDGRLMDAHGGELRAEVVEEIVDELDASERLALLAVVADWRLKVIGLDGNIGWIAGALRLLQRDCTAIGIVAAGKHIVAKHVCSTSEDHRKNRGDVICGHDGTAKVGVLNAAADLSGEEGSSAVG